MDKDTGETTKHHETATGEIVDKTLDNKWNGVKGL